MAIPPAPLSRETRYEPAASAPCPAEGLLRCKSCGSLIAPGDKDLHERMHPRVSCDQVHPGVAVYHPGAHAWEEQYR